MTKLSLLRSVGVLLGMRNMPDNQLQSALTLADQHGWTVGRGTWAIGSISMERWWTIRGRTSECMTSEWRDGAMIWTEYWSPTGHVYTEHYSVLVELLSTNEVTR